MQKASALQGSMKQLFGEYVAMLLTMSPMNPGNEGMIQRGGRKSATKKNYHWDNARTRRKMAAASRKINRRK